MSKGQNKSPHLVQKVTLDLEMANQKDAFKKQQKMSGLFHSCFKPAMEQAMNEYCSNGTVYKLDQLKIDIGNVDLELINEKELYLDFYQQIKKQIALINPEKIIKKNSRDSAIGVFEFFIKNGFMPWESNFKNLADLEDVLMGHENISTDYLLKIFTKRIYIKRLVSQFSDDFYKGVIIELLGEKYYKLIQDEFDRALNFNKKINVKESVLAVIIEELENNKKNGSDLSKKIALKIKELNKEGMMKENTIEKETEINVTEKGESGMSEFTDQAEGTIKDEVYVDHAGIVLLHPFLSRFFEYLNLLENRKFKTEKAAGQAVHLLYYLATGKTGPEEWELPLLKILCGWPLQKPIGKEVELPEGFVGKSEEMLRAVINNWEKLGNASVESLQEGFLQRSGKLEEQEDLWKLTVEQKSIDILMDYLPWNISIIKLPWVKKRIQVDWV